MITIDYKNKTVYGCCKAGEFRQEFSKLNKIFPNPMKYAEFVNTLCPACIPKVTGQGLSRSISIIKVCPECYEKWKIYTKNIAECAENN